MVRQRIRAQDLGPRQQEPVLEIGPKKKFDTIFSDIEKKKFDTDIFFDIRKIIPYVSILDIRYDTSVFGGIVRWYDSGEERR